MINCTSPFPGELDKFQAVGFYDDHESGATFTIFDNSGRIFEMFSSVQTKIFWCRAGSFFGISLEGQVKITNAADGIVRSKR